MSGVEEEGMAEQGEKRKGIKGAGSRLDSAWAARVTRTTRGAALDRRSRGWSASAGCGGLSAMAWPTGLSASPWPTGAVRHVVGWQAMQSASPRPIGPCRPCQDRLDNIFENFQNCTLYITRRVPVSCHGPTNECKYYSSFFYQECAYCV